MEALQQLGIFFGQTLIIVLSIIAIILTIAAVAVKAKGAKVFDLEILNDKVQDQKEALQNILLNDEQLKALKKQKKQEAKQKKNQKEPDLKQAFLLEFLKGDVEASAVEQLKEEINAVLTVAQPNDEIILKIESPGGVVHGYGLAAAQILRLRQAQLKVTVCVDKVAASGGYLMSCVAHHIVASPFAIIGSIGVVAQVPNFNKLLKKYDVDFKEYTAGDYKRTVSLFGEITEKGEAKFKDQLEATHLLFKEFVSQFRPQLDLAQVATGEYWYGQQALKLNLIDSIATSDDYLLKLMKTHRIVKIHFEKKQSLSEKLSEAFAQFSSLYLQKTAEKTLQKMLKEQNKIQL